MPRSIETTEFIPLENGGTSVHWRIKLEDRQEAAVRQFETVAGVIQNVFPKVLEEALPGVLDEDGVGPVPSNNADLQER